METAVTVNFKDGFLFVNVHDEKFVFCPIKVEHISAKGTVVNITQNGYPVEFDLKGSYDIEKDWGVIINWAMRIEKMVNPDYAKMFPRS